MKNSIKRVVSIVLVSLMIFNIFGIIPAFAETSATYTNFALGKTVEFGYTEEVSADTNWGVDAINNGIGALTDGVNDSTVWAVNNADPANYDNNPYIGLKNTCVTGPYSFTVDLGEVYPVSKASLHSITIASYSLWTTKLVTYSISTDGENWETVGSVAAEDVIKTSATTSSGTAITFFNFELTFDTVNARYVKADFETNANSNGVHGFGEFEVYGKNIASGNTDISFEYGSVVATNASWGVSAVDGGVYALTDGVNNGANYWVNNGTSDPTKSNPYIGLNQSYITGPYAFVMDLGEATTVGRIQSYFYDRTDWSVEAPDTVEYYVSADGSSWKLAGEVLKTQATTEAVTDANNPTGQQPTIYCYQLGGSFDDVRYVKVAFDDNDNSTVKIGFGEFEVYEGEPSDIPEGNIIEAVVSLTETYNFHLIEGTLTYSDNLYYIEDSFYSPYVEDMVVSEADGVISFGAESLDGNAYDIMDTGVLCSAKFVVLEEGVVTSVTSDISRVLINTGSEYQEMGTGSEVYINSLGDSCGGDLTWSFDDSTGTLTVSGTGDMYTFTDAVRVPWLSISNDITNVVIEEGVTSIGDYAFANCLNIEKVSLPTTLNSIGVRAFAGSEFTGSSLTSIEIPDGVTHIGNYAFQFSGLTSVEIPDSVTSLGDYVFAYCSSLTSAKLPAGSTRIGAGFFAGCKQLASITIPEGVETICSGAFESCYALTEIQIPDSVTSIEGAAFSWCIGLTSIDLSENLTSLGNSAFLGCRSLASIELPDTLTTIGENAFSNCSALTRVTIPESVTAIGDMAFDGVADDFTAYVYLDTAGYTYVTENSINYVVMGSIGDNAEFKFDPSTGVLTISGTGDTYSYGKEEGAPWFDFRTSITKVVVEDGITSLGDSLFYYYSSLTEIEIADSVTSIGSYTFGRCTKLTSIDLPANLTTIGSCAFQRCTALTSVTLPEGLTTINSSAFDYCIKLETVEIPDTVTTLGISVFSNCTGLTGVVLPENLTSIPASFFSGCEKLETVEIPSTVTSIGNSAFSYTALASVELPKALESIGERAFAGCTNMTSVVVPVGVTTVGTGAFSDISDEFVVYGYCGSAAQTTMVSDGVTFTGFGDADGNGELSISDVTAIQKQLAKISTIENTDMFATDVNGDGKLSIRDVTYIQMLLVQTIAEFPITE